MKSLVATAAVAAALLTPALASATVLHFKGTATADAETSVSFEVKGHNKTVKKGKKSKKVFVATTVSNVHVENQLFICYDTSGNPATSGRTTIPCDFFNISPMTVSKSGAFSGVYEFAVESSVITRETFTGRIKGRTAKGTFQTQYDPGGIQYGYCGNMSGEPYTAKG